MSSADRSTKDVLNLYNKVINKIKKIENHIMRPKVVFENLDPIKVDCSLFNEFTTYTANIEDIDDFAEKWLLYICNEYVTTSNLSIIAADYFYTEKTNFLFQQFDKLNKLKIRLLLPNLFNNKLQTIEQLIDIIRENNNCSELVNFSIFDQMYLIFDKKNDVKTQLELFSNLLLNINKKNAICIISILVESKSKQNTLTNKQLQALSCFH